MTEPTAPIRTRHIAFRVTEAEFDQIERFVEGRPVGPNLRWLALAGKPRPRIDDADFPLRGTIVTEETAAHPDATNTGIRTGHVVAVDIDVSDPDHAETVRAVVEKYLGPMSGEALFVFAVVTYCRALISQGDGRYGTNVPYPPELMAAHKGMGWLRDKRLCHYGPRVEADDEDPWFDDRVVATLGTSVRMRSAGSRRGWKAAAVRDLDALLTYAIPVVQGQAREEALRVADALLEVGPEAQFQQLALASQFRPQDLFRDIAPGEAMDGGDVQPFDGVIMGHTVEEP